MEAIEKRNWSKIVEGIGCVVIDIISLRTGLRDIALEEARAKCLVELKRKQEQFNLIEAVKTSIEQGGMIEKAKDSFYKMASEKGCFEYIWNILNNL